MIKIVTSDFFMHQVHECCVVIYQSEKIILTIISGLVVSMVASFARGHIVQSENE